MTGRVYALRRDSDGLVLPVRLFDRVVAEATRAHYQRTLHESFSIIPAPQL